MFCSIHCLIRSWAAFRWDRFSLSISRSASTRMAEAGISADSAQASPKETVPSNRAGKAPHKNQERSPYHNQREDGQPFSPQHTAQQQLETEGRDNGKAQHHPGRHRGTDGQHEIEKQGCGKKQKQSSICPVFHNNHTPLSSAGSGKAGKAQNPSERKASAFFQTIPLYCTVGLMRYRFVTNAIPWAAG